MHLTETIALATMLVQQQPSNGCGPTSVIDRMLVDEFGEDILAAGITTGGIIYITTNPGTGSFTILLRKPDGTSCVLMGGKGMAVVEPKEKVRGREL